MPALLLLVLLAACMAESIEPPRATCAAIVVPQGPCADDADCAPAVCRRGACVMRSVTIHSREPCSPTGCPYGVCAGERCEPLDDGEPCSDDLECASRRCSL